MLHNMLLKLKKTINSLFGSVKNKQKTVVGVDKNKEPLRHDFELAILFSFVGNLSLAKNGNGEYLDPKVQSSWWSWREVYAADYNEEAERFTQEQHKEIFQKALLNSPYASHHSSSELLAVNDNNYYSIDWVASAWSAWMQATYMYKIQ